MGDRKRTLSIETLAANTSNYTDSRVKRRQRELIIPVTGAIYQTSSFIHTAAGRFSYTRRENPTREALEDKAALLEGGKFAFAFTSGLAAAVSALSTLKTGDTAVISQDVYGGTSRIAKNLFSSYGINTVNADFSKEEESIIPDGCRAVLIESAGNPLLKVPDIRKIAAAAHEKGAILIADNTFLTPCFLRPLELGADIVLYSATKFYSGHHDATAGILVTNDEKTAKLLAKSQETQGNALAPFEAFLVTRGIKTLALRMEKHAKNAEEVFRFLKTRKEIAKIYYTNDPESESFALHKSQSSGPCPVISFELRSAAAAHLLTKKLRLIKFAESLGGTESLITHPATQTHACLTAAERKKAGISSRLLRLSVGIENSEDIISDLAFALDGCEN